MERAREHEVLLAGEIEASALRGARARTGGRRSAARARGSPAGAAEVPRRAARRPDATSGSAESPQKQTQRSETGTDALGALSSCVQQTDEMLRRLDEPLTPTAPLAPGRSGDCARARRSRHDRDARGRRGGGDRHRRPARARAGRAARARLAIECPAAETEPAVRVVAASRADVSDQLDVRGTTRTGGARGCSLPRGRRRSRGPADGACRPRPRRRRPSRGRREASSTSHALVERYEPDSADGATLVHLA